MQQRYLYIYRDITYVDVSKYKLNNFECTYLKYIERLDNLHYMLTNINYLH